jgi:hypothetical protein
VADLKTRLTGQRVDISDINLPTLKQLIKESVKHMLKVHGNLVAL